VLKLALFFYQVIDSKALIGFDPHLKGVFRLRCPYGIPLRAFTDLVSYSIIFVPAVPELNPAISSQHSDADLRQLVAQGYFSQAQLL